MNVELVEVNVLSNRLNVEHLHCRLPADVATAARSNPHCVASRSRPILRNDTRLQTRHSRFRYGTVASSCVSHVPEPMLLVAHGDILTAQC